MPGVDWKAFAELPGSQQYNFEMLCRALVRRHYGRFGQFLALASQPGVEFHLHLHTACALGAAGQWFGWQCRWYDLPSGKALGTTRRQKILEAIRKTEKNLPRLTDWILWTRHPLTKGDQTWFFRQKTRMRLTLWTSVEVEELLSGEGEIYRASYFGELILTPEGMRDLHGNHVARVRRRWIPEVHQTIEVERKIRRMLGESQSWDQLTEVSARLTSSAKSMARDLVGFSGPVADAGLELAKSGEGIASILKDSHALLRRGDLDLLRQQLATRVALRNPNLRSVPRRLRGARHVAAMLASNVMADIHLAHQLLDEIHDCLGQRLIGVLADAGAGKTQLAAQLTAPLSDRPAGILLFGQDLHAGHDLNDLAHSVVIHGKPIQSIEALVAAVDAAGQRAHRRLPVVIDGLNEAEDPRDWKGPLASLNEILKEYPYVLVVCTIRTGARTPTPEEWRRARFAAEAPQPLTGVRRAFADEALPEGIDCLDLPGFGEDTISAIGRYFRYFHINSGDADLPVSMLRHPLTLRFFCEVTNPTREKVVGVEAMPGSLTALFEKYLSQAAQRIAELSPRSHRYYHQDVTRAFDEIGARLWSQASRTISERELRQVLGDETRPWDESIVRALEQEGVVLRTPGNAPGEMQVMAVYDALGGHLAVQAILSRQGRDSFAAWLKEADTLAALGGVEYRPTVGSLSGPAPVAEPTRKVHPLAVDIFRALVGLVPRRIQGQQLWPLLGEPLRSTALVAAARLEGAFLDAATVSELAALASTEKTAGTLFSRLHETRSSPGHPLNANFLTFVLRSKSVAERDLRWTEWLRRNRNGFLNDLNYLEQRWRGSPKRSQSDRLRARWIMWTLTTTMRDLRDRATRALYWFGRGDPEALFEDAIESLGINDPYVPERMLAASYGVAMARHPEIISGALDRTFLSKCARRLFDSMFAKDAPYGTSHVLTREYGRRFLELALVHDRKLLTPLEKPRIIPPFRDDGLRAWNSAEIVQDEVSGIHSPFRMDFENYTLGRLVPHRSNYDFKDADYQKVRAQVLWRIQELGWSPERFEEIDNQIAREFSHGRASDEKTKTDRYGKKYSWIAYFELAGLRRDQGKISRDDEDDRPCEVDVDPSFPQPLPEHQLINDDFLGDPATPRKEWIANGAKPRVEPYLRLGTIQDQHGPWVMLDGFFTQEDTRRGRRIFCCIRSFLIANRSASRFQSLLTKQSLHGRWLPEKPSTVYVFAGEVPWSNNFPENGTTQLRFVIGEKRVKVRKRRTVYFLDGKEVHLKRFDVLGYRMFGDAWSSDKDDEQPLSPDEVNRLQARVRLVEEEEAQPEMESCEVLIPACDFGWEGGDLDGASVHATTLAKELADELQLVGQPQTFDLFGRDAQKTTLVFGDRREYNNSQSFLYIRERLLNQYLRRHKLTLIWAIWGERQRSMKGATDFARLELERASEQTYQVYQKIKTYKPSGR